MEPSEGVAPNPRARLAGFFYLLTFLTGAGAAVFVGPRLAPYSGIANLIATGFYLVVTLLFYQMFQPVNRPLSMLAACFSLAGCTTTVVGVFHLAPARINALVFFGFYCLSIGLLIFRSGFLPRFLGVLMALGGLGWLTFLSVPLAHSLYPFNLAPGIVGEGALTLWLLVMGVDVERWRQKAAPNRGARSSMAGAA